MEKQTFRISIDAPREKVWDTLWNDETYREWTSVFSPGSRAETDWKEGSKVLFLNGEGDGMISRISVTRPPEFLSFEHLGEVSKGVEDLESERVKLWAGATENYTLRPLDGKTEVTVELDVTDEFKDYFRETWPRALDKLKSIAERQHQDAVASPS